MFLFEDSRMSISDRELKGLEIKLPLSAGQIKAAARGLQPLPPMLNPGAAAAQAAINQLPPAASTRGAGAAIRSGIHGVGSLANRVPAGHGFQQAQQAVLGHPYVQAVAGNPYVQAAANGLQQFRDAAAALPGAQTAGQILLHPGIRFGAAPAISYAWQHPPEDPAVAEVSARINRAGGGNELPPLESAYRPPANANASELEREAPVQVGSALGNIGVDVVSGLPQGTQSTEAFQAMLQQNIERARAGIEAASGKLEGSGVNPGLLQQALAVAAVAAFPTLLVNPEVRQALGVLPSSNSRSRKRKQQKRKFQKSRKSRN